MKIDKYAAALAVMAFVLSGAPDAFAQEEARPAVASETIVAPSGVGLQDAIKKALTASPRLKSADATVAGAAGNRSQASAWANPEVSVEAENIGGSGPYSGVRSAEMTAGVSQLIEIGGKRSARIDVADREQEAATIQRRIAEADLVLDVTKAYANAVAAQEEVALYQNQVNLAEDVLSVVGQRVSAAAEPVIQQSKAKVAFASSKIALEKAQRNESAAGRTLALLIGEPAKVRANSTDFYQVSEPAQSDAEAALMNGLDFRYNAALLEKANATIDLERAAAVPDPTISAGVRQFREDDEQAFLVGVSLPLPIFNLNGGNIEKAKQEASKADADRLVALQDSMARLEEHRQQLQASYIEISQIKETVLPQAEAAFTQARRGYNAGKFAYLEVLDAQRTLADAKLSYVAALKDYHTNKAEIDRLTVGQADKETAQ